jgi:hypothetical protein
MYMPDILGSRALPIVLYGCIVTPVTTYRLVQMESRTLSAVGVGDVPQWLADEGLELAARYFEEHDLDPVACYTRPSFPVQEVSWLLIGIKLT